MNVMVAAAIAGVVMAAMMTMLRSQGRAQRQIAALAGVTDLAHGLDVLFGSPQCGSLGTASFGKNGASPVSVAVSGTGYALDLDTIRFKAGPVAVTSLADAEIKRLTQPHSVAPFVLTALGGEGPSGTGFVYPFRLTVPFQSPAGTVPPQPIVKSITVYTNAAREVVGACFGTTSASSLAHATLYRNGSFSIPSNAAWYALPWNGTLSKHNVTHSVTANPHQIAIQEPGTYDIGYAVNFQHNGTMTGYARLLRNGTEVPGTMGSAGLTGWSAIVSHRVVLDLAANDVLTVEVGKNGGAVDVDYWHSFSPYDPPVPTVPSAASLSLVKLP